MELGLLRVTPPQARKLVICVVSLGGPWVSALKPPEVKAQIRLKALSKMSQQSDKFQTIVAWLETK